MPLPSEEDRYYLDRFVSFVKEWERKSERKQLRDFIEYLAYFHEARRRHLPGRRNYR